MQVKDELSLIPDATISILRDVAGVRLLQVKKYMSSLIRALRKLSSAFSHLKDYAIGLKILELGLTAQSHMRRRK